MNSNLDSDSLLILKELCAKGYALMSIRDFANASNYYQLSLKVSRNYVNLKMLGLCQNALGNYSYAINLMKEALELKGVLIGIFI